MKIYEVKKENEDNWEWEHQAYYQKYENALNHCQRQGRHTVVEHNFAD